MTPRWDVIGLGSTTIDDLLYVSTFPTPDTKVPILQRDRQGGGVTATALVAIARLGGRPAFAGLLGDDESSQWVADDLVAEGVDVSPAVRRPDARPIHSYVVVAQDSGVRTILFSVDGLMGAAADQPAPEVIQAARLVFVDDFGIPGSLRAAHIAREAGLPVVADFETGDSPLFPQLLGLADHLIINARFAAALTGVADPAESVRLLWVDGRAVAVVTNGEAGCWYTVDGRGVQHQPAYRVEVVDTTGCGDVFHGAYAWGLTQDLPIEERIRFAAGAAALKATQPGGRRGIPSRSRLEAFLQDKA